MLPSKDVTILTTHVFGSSTVPPGSRAGLRWRRHLLISPAGGGRNASGSTIGRDVMKRDAARCEDAVREAGTCKPSLALAAGSPNHAWGRKRGRYPRGGRGEAQSPGPWRPRCTPVWSGFPWTGEFTGCPQKSAQDFFIFFIFIFIK